MKQCNKCYNIKDEAFFGIEKRTKKPRSWCKQCCTDAEKRRVNNHRIRIRAREKELRQLPHNFIKTRNKILLKIFGISGEQYNLMLQEQNQVCYICKSPETCTYRGKLRHLAIDHNHQTGKIRKLLCAKCNKSLGLLKEDPNIIMNMYNYIIKEN